MSIRTKGARAAVVILALLVPMLAVPSRADAATQTFTGSVDAASTSTNRAVFNISVPQTGAISGSLSWTGTADLNLYLKDPGGTIVASGATTKANPENVSTNATQTGVWKMVVMARTGAASFSLNATYPGGSTSNAPQFVRSIGAPGVGHASMYPSGLDVDAAGNVYAADTGDDAVQKYGPDGTKLWESSAPGLGLGAFNNPRDVAYLDGRVYVADTGFARVQVLDADNGQPLQIWPVNNFGTLMGISAGVDGLGRGIMLVSDSLPTSTVRIFRPSAATPPGSPVEASSVGTGPGTGNGQLNEHRDAATDSNGNIYVADYKNQRVAKFGPSGNWITSWGTMGTGVGQFRLPYGIDVDDADRIYVADGNNQRIQKFDATGHALTPIYGSPGTGAGKFEMLRRVAVGSGPSPMVYGADLWRYKIERFFQNGTPDQTFGGVAPADGSFNEPYGIAVDAQSTFVMDTTNQRVQRFQSATGANPYAFSTKWGERGWGENNPGFNWGRDVAINSVSNTVWAADTKNSRLTEFSRDGTPTGKVLGARGANIGQLNYPYAVASYGGDIIVADSKNNRIQRWHPADKSVVWSVGGFNFPRDVTVDGDTVYVADTRNKRVVKLNALNGASQGSFTHADLHNVEGIVVTPAGHIWTADTDWNRLIEFTAGGQLIQKFGNSGTGQTQFNFPSHLEIVSAGSTLLLYVADVQNDRVQVFSLGSSS